MLVLYAISQWDVHTVEFTFPHSDWLQTPGSWPNHSQTYVDIRLNILHLM